MIMDRALWTFVLLSFIAFEACQADVSHVENDKRVVCNKYWTEFRGNCYYINPYKVSRDAGERQCKKNGYGLAVIRDKETNDFIVKLGSTRYFSDAVWLGLNDKSQEGKFVWANGEAMTYSNWNHGEPNGAHEDCTMMYLKSTLKGKWNDDQCFKRYEAVCQQYKGSSASTATSACRPGWKEFRGNCYKLSTRGGNWITAQMTCKKAGGYSLAKIPDKATNDFILSLTSPIKFWRHVWIGANDRRWENHFFWDGDGEVNYTNWAPKRPDKSGDCAVMRASGEHKGKWNDADCFDFNYYICQQRLN